jgi:nucleoside-diphosphate-sugar epimerase
MKILVIGGSGVISTAVTQQLIDRGDAVTVFNRGQTPARFRGAVQRLTGDRTDHPAFEQAVRAAGPWDCVIDMICSDPADAASLARAAHGQVGQVIFCSTTNVYPKPADRYPVAPGHRLGAAYKNGIDKAACETLHRETADGGGYALTIIRPGHTYGEGNRQVLNSLGADASLLDRFRRGRPVIVHGDGQGLWSALHADDVAACFAAAAGLPAAFGRAFNATGETWLTWGQYHHAIGEALELAADPEWVHIPVDFLLKQSPQRANHVARSLQFPGIYDMASTRQILGVGQTIALAEGLRRTIRRIEANGGIPPCAGDPEYDRILGAWQRQRATW